MVPLLNKVSTNVCINSGGRRDDATSKTCNLDLQCQIGLQTGKIFVLTFKLTYLEFAFTLKLFIDHLIISDLFKIW